MINMLVGGQDGDKQEYKRHGWKLEEILIFSSTKHTDSRNTTKDHLMTVSSVGGIFFVIKVVF